MNKAYLFAGVLGLGFLAVAFDVLQQADDLEPVRAAALIVAATALVLGAALSARIAAKEAGLAILITGALVLAALWAVVLDGSMPGRSEDDIQADAASAVEAARNPVDDLGNPVTLSAAQAKAIREKVITRERAENALGVRFREFAGTSQGATIFWILGADLVTFLACGLAVVRVTGREGRTRRRSTWADVAAGLDDDETP